MCPSISKIFSMLEGTIKVFGIFFSTASTTPSFVTSPMAVEPSLIASIAYSIWKSRPSGDQHPTLRSYSDRPAKDILVATLFSFLLRVNLNVNLN